MSLFPKIKDNSIWKTECKNCSCINSVPYCEQINCKYEPCQKGQVYLLSKGECCPKCDVPKKFCKYDGVLIDVCFTLFFVVVVLRNYKNIIFEYISA